jgi:hypothetical protein
MANAPIPAARNSVDGDADLQPIWSMTENAPPNGARFPFWTEYERGTINCGPTAVGHAIEGPIMDAQTVTNAGNNRARPAGAR